MMSILTLSKLDDRYYDVDMTKLFLEAVKQARTLPPKVQDFFATALLDMVASDTPSLLSLKEREFLLEGIEAADRGKFASEEEVQAAFDLFET